MTNEIRDSLRSLEARMDKRFEQVDRRFEQMDLRLTEGFNRTDARFDAMDAKMSRQFVWLAGMLITTLIAILGTLGAIVAATIP